MALEREVKLRVPHSDFINALKSAGLIYELMGSSPQEDIYLDFDDCRLLLSDSALRIRISDRGLLIAYKGPRRFEYGEKVREELEGPLGGEECEFILKKLGISEKCSEDLMSFLETLGRLGLTEKIRVRKERRELRVIGLELKVYLDEVKGLGEFVEVEGEGSIELIRKLGMSCNIVIPSYAHLIQAVKFGNSRPLQ